MGRLATTRMFAGVWLCEVSGPRGKVSLESGSWRRETYCNIGDVNGCI